MTQFLTLPAPQHTSFKGLEDFLPEYPHDCVLTQISRFFAPRFCILHRLTGKSFLIPSADNILSAYRCPFCGPFTRWPLSSSWSHLIYPGYWRDAAYLQLMRPAAQTHHTEPASPVKITEQLHASPQVIDWNGRQRQLDLLYSVGGALDQKVS